MAFYVKELVLSICYISCRYMLERPYTGDTYALSLLVHIILMDSVPANIKKQMSQVFTTSLANCDVAATCINLILHKNVFIFAYGM